MARWRDGAAANRNAREISRLWENYFCTRELRGSARLPATSSVERDKPGLSVSLVHLVYLVYLVQPNRRDKPNKPNNGLLTLADFFSILLGWEERAPTEDSIGTTEILAGL